MQHFTRVCLFVSLAALAGCSSGGGGSASPNLSSAVSSGSSGATSSGSTSSGSSSGSSASSGSGSVAAAPQTYLAASAASLGANAPLLEGKAANGNPLAVSTFSNAAPVGTVFPLLQSAVSYPGDISSVMPAGTANSGGATLTYKGTVTSPINGTQVPTWELAIPALGVDVTTSFGQQNIPPTSNGFGVQLAGQSLNYMFMGNWNLIQSSGTGAAQKDYYGFYVTGFQTPTSAVPTSGQGIYMTSVTTGGSSGVINGVTTPPVSGVIFLTPAPGLVTTANLSGNASVTVNFGTGAVSGALTNMVAGIGNALPWNNVSLTGTLSGAAVAGTTSATSTTSSYYSFDASSTGVFNGALYGPNGQELGVVWTLHDPTGLGKTAVGTIAAEKSN